MKYKQGMFKPQNPKKYKGDTKVIVYRSWLEFRVMSKLDMDPTVTKWASEEFYVPYKSPLDKKTHRYFVDLFFEKKQNGKTEKFICEVKPFDQTKPPKSKGKKLLMESMTYAVNIAKWQAANRWAKQSGCKFILWTEKDFG
jgi:hypothetical protein